MQRYVMMSPAYKKHNDQEVYLKAFNGDKEAQDFCMINFKTCRIELKMFYVLQTMQEGETGFTNEDLLNWENWDYLPLF